MRVFLNRAAYVAVASALVMYVRYLFGPLPHGSEFWTTVSDVGAFGTTAMIAAIAGAVFPITFGLGVLLLGGGLMAWGMLSGEMQGFEIAAWFVLSIAAPILLPTAHFLLFGRGNRRVAR